MDNLAENWQKLSLNNREDENLELPEQNSSNEFTLAAKFLTKRALSVKAVIRTFSPLWRSVKGFEVRRVGNHVLLFVFNDKQEADNILSNARWSFDKHLVVLQWYDRKVHSRALEFSKIPVWV